MVLHKGLKEPQGTQWKNGAGAYRFCNVFTNTLKGSDGDPIGIRVETL